VSTPGRSSTGSPLVQSTMLDSIPTSQGPPSEHHHGVAELGGDVLGGGRLMRPKRLALGAATPATRPPAARLQAARVPTGCDGQRRPIVGCPPPRGADAGRARHDDRERPGPERGHQAHGHGRNLRGEGARAVGVGHVHDERMVGGDGLGREDLRHRGVVVGTRAQAVHGLGGKRDQLAGGERGGCASDDGGIGSVEQHGQKAGRPSSAAALEAVARASAKVAAVTVRWPILRPRRALVLPYRCRLAPGQREHVGPRRLDRGVAGAEPQVAEQIEHRPAAEVQAAARTSGAPAACAPAGRTARRRTRRLL
jgi:hypothetical protein